MNDSALGRFIEAGDERANFLNIGFRCAPGALLQGTQPRPHAAVMTRARERLPCTFACRFCVRHLIELKDLRARRLAARREIVKMSILSSSSALPDFERDFMRAA
jgi:hypothetical protein